MVCGVGALLGLRIGRSIYDLGTLPELAAMAAMAAGVMFVGALGVLVVIGIALMAFRQEGPGGTVMLIAAWTGVGGFVGYMLGYAVS